MEKVCRFFVQGKCTAGKNCNYSHEMPDEKTFETV